MTLGRYSALVLAIVAGSLAALWVTAGPALGSGGIRAAVAGGALAAANTIAAYGLVLWSSGRSNNAFLGAVLGGMAGRMGIMLAAVVAGVLWLGLPKAPLAVALLSYFTLFLAIELSVLHRRSGAHEHTQ